MSGWDLFLTGYERLRGVSTLKKDGFERGISFQGLPSLKRTAKAPANRVSQKERIVFPPSIFRCYVSFRDIRAFLLSMLVFTYCGCNAGIETWHNSWFLRCLYLLNHLRRRIGWDTPCCWPTAKQRMQQGNSESWFFKTKLRETGWTKKTTLAHFSNWGLSEKIGKSQIQTFFKWLPVFFGSSIAISLKNPDPSYGKRSVSVKTPKHDIPIALLGNGAQGLTPKSSNISIFGFQHFRPWKRAKTQKERIAFQSSIFTCYVSFREGILSVEIHKLRMFFLHFWPINCGNRSVMPSKKRKGNIFCRKFRYLNIWRSYFDWGLEDL